MRCRNRVSEKKRGSGRKAGLLRRRTSWESAEQRSRNNRRLVKVAITLRVMIGNKHWTVFSRMARTLLTTRRKKSAPRHSFGAGAAVSLLASFPAKRSRRFCNDLAFVSS